jgi:asparagine synthase (glutamine-hydrolysing)
VVDAALALPDRQLIDAGVNKILLRDVAARWLPPEIVHRRKQGFNLPMRRWLAEWIAAQGGMAAYSADLDALGLDSAATNKLVSDDIAAGVARERLILALILLVEWHRSFRSKTAALEAKIGRLS